MKKILISSLLFSALFGNFSFADEAQLSSQISSDSNSTINQAEGKRYYDLALTYRWKNFNEEKLLTNLERSASYGYTKANMLLGLYYKNDKKDYKKAFENYSIAANAGIGDGFAALGSIYNNGLGVAKDPQKAIEYYEKAMALDSGWAYTDIGYLGYKKGEFGYEKNDQKAVEYYKKGCELGSDAGCYNLGRAHQYGIAGLEVNGQKAVEYYEKAAALDNSRAMVDLSLLYKNWDSHLVPKDKEKSKYWEDRALEIGQASDVIAIGASKGMGSLFGLFR
ncbi:tetratricopeptide repeat protein [Aquamicrobium sp.]|uniref:tetratricopeptide repeat protein n=1 Tax=Aquamicrobium sp. TaxID=1872579 RepID=UPI0025839492|nr:tetratricopeptide repeat protein [Aquamicrobium sp.]MCK9549467.1 sel1 repeat family protein [Aquamicrobium sp.]